MYFVTWDQWSMCPLGSRVLSSELHQLEVPSRSPLLSLGWPLSFARWLCVWGWAGTDAPDLLAMGTIQQGRRGESVPGFVYLQQGEGLWFSRWYTHVNTPVLCTPTCEVQILSPGEQSILMKVNNSANLPDVLATWCHAAGWSKTTSCLVSHKWRM